MNYAANILAYWVGVAAALVVLLAWAAHIWRYTYPRLPEGPLHAFAFYTESAVWMLTGLGFVFITAEWFGTKRRAGYGLSLILAELGIALFVVGLIGWGIVPAVANRNRNRKGDQ